MNIRSQRKRRGFTLIELMAVIVVLAILAGVALPKYFDYSAQAKESSCKGTLGGVRAGVANFYADQAIAGTAGYPTFAEMGVAGTVMQETLPDNPYNGLATISDEDTLWLAVPPVDGLTGWAYDETQGKFWANSTTSGVDEHLF